MPKLTQNQIKEAFLEDSDYLTTGESYVDLQVKLAQQRMEQAMKGNNLTEMMNASRSFLVTLQAREITTKILPLRGHEDSKVLAHFPRIKEMFFRGGYTRLLDAMN